MEVNQEASMQPKESKRRARSWTRLHNAPPDTPSSVVYLPPFRGPTDFANEIRAQNGFIGEEVSPISRVEKEYSKERSTSVYRAKFILNRLPRLLQKKNYHMALNMVNKARGWYKNARSERER